jgi:hypothetical protein
MGIKVLPSSVFPVLGSRFALDVTDSPPIPSLTVSALGPLGFDEAVGGARAEGGRAAAGGGLPGPRHRHRRKPQHLPVPGESPPSIYCTDSLPLRLEWCELSLFDRSGLGMPCWYYGDGVLVHACCQCHWVTRLHLGSWASSLEHYE